MTTPAKAMPVNRRLAMIERGNLDDGPRREARGIDQGAGHEDARAGRSGRSTQPMTSIEGISAAAESPAESGDVRRPAAQIDEPEAQERVAGDHPDVDERDRQQHGTQPRRHPKRDARRSELPRPPAAVARRPGGSVRVEVGALDVGDQRRREPAMITAHAAQMTNAGVYPRPVVQEAGRDGPDRERRGWSGDGRAHTRRCDRGRAAR